MSRAALDLAAELATRPGFDCIHDPDPRTPLIEPYYDPVGYPTQGYGRLLSREKWAPLDRWQPVTKEQAWADLLDDMGKALRAVLRLCPVPLSPERTAALADFTFNCGAGNLQASALRRAILRCDHEEAARQFDVWVYSAGRKLTGLVRRRAAERALYTSADR